MGGTGDFKVAVKLHADASQYTAEFTKASQLAQTFADTLQSGGNQAASGLQTAATASQALGTTTASSSQQASSGLNQVSTAAQNLGSTLQATGTQATQASQGMDGMSKSSREATQSQQQSRAAGDALIAMLRDQIATTGKSAEELLRYRAAQSGVAAEAAPLILQWQNQKAAQLAAAEAARLEEAAQRSAMAEKQQNAAAQERFLKGLQEEVALRGKSATEVLQYRAAELGVSAQAANSIRILDEANKKGAISAGQHAAAMRMLPAQMTDVVTSVASGMPIWMVAIQQGGQIKDSFGGAGAAARAMLGAITPLAAGLTAVAAGVGLTVAAYYQGSAEADRYRQAIVTTGNASGVTVDQLSQYAKEIDGVVGTQARAAEGLAAFTAAGVEGGAQLRQYTQTAIEWENATGQAVTKTAEQFASLQKDPLNATLKLNEGMNFLTASTFEQIKALTDQGQSAEASRVAMDALDAAMRERSKTIKENLGWIERGWNSIKGAAAEAWDAMLNIGRSSSIGDQIAKAQEALDKKLAEGPGLFDRAQHNQAVERLRGEIWALQEKSNAELAGAIAQEHQNKATQAAIAWSKQREQHLSKEEKKTRDLTKARSDYESRLETLDNTDTAARLKLEKEYQAVVTNINEQYKERKGKGSGGISVTDNQLATLRGQLETAKQYHEQLVTLGAGASELNAGERESLKIAQQLKVATDAKTVARLKEKQVLADALGVQLRTNEGLEKGYKAEQQQHEAMLRGTESITQRAKDQEAANAVFGKGRTAIEQMTLAELEHQLAEAKGGKASAQRISDLEEQIAAQKRWVNALGQADYKAITAHVDELLRNAQELSKTYEDELALSGLTALEREKIVAQRAVELKYAKELAKIDRSSLTEDEKRAKRKDIEQARDIESAAVVAKAQETHMAKASEEINRSLTDALMRGFESGKDMAQNFADTVKNMFNTMVLRPVISAVMAPVSGVINGVVQQGLNAVGLGSGSSLLGTASNASSLYSLVSGNSLLNTAAGWLGLGGTTAATGLAASLGSGMALAGTSAGLGMTAGVGTGLGLVGGGGLGLTAGSAGAGAIGAGLGTSAAAGGAAAGGLSGALAAVPGWGWAAMGALALLGGSGLFGHKSTQEYGGTAMYSAALGAQTSTTHGAFGTGFGGVAANDQILANVSGISKSIVDALDTTAKSFGKTVGYEAAAGFASDFGEDATWGGLRIALGGKDIVNWNDNRQTRWAPKEFGSGEEGYKQYLNAVALDVKTALQTMDLPGWANQALAAANDMESISAALKSIGAQKSLFDAWGKSMQMFAGISGEMQTQLLTAAGSPDALANNVNAFYQGFYTEAERMTSLQQQLQDSISGMGLSIDPADGERAKQQFKQAVNDAMAAGRGELAAQLLSLSSTFETAADYAKKTAETLNGLLSEGQSLATELLRAQGDEAGYLAAIREKSTQGYSDAERAAWDYNRALQSQIDALTQASQLETSLAQITGKAGQSVQELLQSIMGRVQATADYRTNLAGSIESARLGTMDAAGQAAYLRQKESGLWGQLSSAADPVAVAEQLQQTILDRISAESQLREQLDGQTLGALQQQLSVAQSLQSAAQSMQSTVDGLRLGNTSALNPYAQLQYASSKFDDAYARARAGDLDAWKDVQSFGQNYVGLGRDVFASSTDSADIFFKVTEAMDQLAAMGLDADPQITALNTQIDLLKTVGDNTEQSTWTAQQQLDSLTRLDDVMRQQQDKQQQQLDKQLALAQQQIDELRTQNGLLQAQIEQQAAIEKARAERDKKQLAAVEKAADSARMQESQA